MPSAAPMTMLDVSMTAMSPRDPVAAAPTAGPAETISLADLPAGAFGTIEAVLPGSGDDPLVLRLIEIGFVPGERVRIVARGRPGNEPIAVRLAATDSGRRNRSGATFALRRHEADLVRIVPDQPLRR